MLTKILAKTLDVVFPPQCLNCDSMVATQGTLCQPCWQQAHFITPPFCHCCGLPFDFAMGEGALCAECIQQLPAFARGRAALRYDEHSKGLVLKLKYADQTQLAATYGPWLARAGAELVAASDVIVPVPLHYWRFVGRRYNQSALLAYALNKQCALPVIPDALIRLRHTPPQTGLSRRARHDNVKNAFRANPRHSEELKGKTILLIDDVMTTSATASQCSKALLNAGAQQVNVLVLARATA